MFDKNIVEKIAEIIHKENNDELNEFVDYLLLISNCDKYLDDSSILKEFPGSYKIIDKYINMVPLYDGDKYKIVIKCPHKLGSVEGNITSDAQVYYDKHGPLEAYFPLYDLYAIRRKEFDAYEPDNFVTLGEFFKIGPMREGGSLKYPSIAMPLYEGQHIQIHKIGSVIKVFNSNGSKTSVSNTLSKCLIDIWTTTNVENAVFNAVFDGEKLHIFDIFLHEDNHRTFMLPLHKRMALLNNINFGDNVTIFEHKIIKNDEDLRNLDNGKWVCRWTEERVNISRPFWFVININKYKQSADFSVFDSLYADKEIDFIYKLNNIIFDCNSIYIKNSQLDTKKELSGRFILGVRGEDFQELFIMFDDANYLNGIYKYNNDCSLEKTSSSVALDDYNNNKYNSQYMYNILHLEALSKSSLVYLLPKNWESIIEHYEEIV